MIVIWFTYPLWGWFLMLPFCMLTARAVQGSIAYRIFGAFVVGTITAAIFTPIIVGGQGFMFIVPWEAGYIDNQSYGPFDWYLMIPMFCVASILALPFTKGSKKRLI
jgi:hypothetical protein